MSRLRQSSAGHFFQGIPLVTRSIMALCSVIWLLELFTWKAWAVVWNELVLFRPFPEVWQLISYQFLHSPGGVLHVLMNMYLLWWAGSALEGRWGPKTFLQFYLTCGVGAGLAHVLLGYLTHAPAPVFGASGAVMGALIAFGMTWPNREILFMLVIPMKMKHAVLVFVALDLFGAFSAHPTNNIANVAHLGGALTGYLYMKQAWRVSSTDGLFGGIKSWFSERRRKHRVLSIVKDEKEWDEWLKEELDDKPGKETRH